MNPIKSVLPNERAIFLTSFLPQNWDENIEVAVAMAFNVTKKIKGNLEPSPTAAITS